MHFTSAFIIKRKEQRWSPIQTPAGILMGNESLSCSTVVPYIEIMKVWDFLSQNITQNQLKFYFVTSRQDWLGIAKNVFISTINHSTKLIGSF